MGFFGFGLCLGPLFGPDFIAGCVSSSWLSACGGWLRGTGASHLVHKNDPVASLGSLPLTGHFDMEPPAVAKNSDFEPLVAARPLAMELVVGGKHFAMKAMIAAHHMMTARPGMPVLQGLPGEVDGVLTGGCQEL